MDWSRVKRMRFLLLGVILTGVVVAAACQGEMGSQGLQGQPGVAGPQGPQGAQGVQGPAISQEQIQASLVALIQPAIDDGVFVGNQGDQGPQGPQGEAGPPGEPGEVQVGIGLALDKAAYLAHDEVTVGDETVTVLGDESISVYGSGFVRGEYVLPQIQGANPRGFVAEGVNADANGAFSTTITLNTGANRVQPGVYTIRVTGGEGSVATIPIVISEK